MSSDIYIPLSTVLNQPGHFELKTDYNVGIEDAKKELSLEHPDDYWVNECLKPVLLCRFGRRYTWRAVEVIIPDPEYPGGLPPNLHISCGGDFRHWLMQWLDDHNFPYTVY